MFQEWKSDQSTVWNAVEILHCLGVNEHCGQEIYDSWSFSLVLSLEFIHVDSKDQSAPIPG